MKIIEDLFYAEDGGEYGGDCDFTPGDNSTRHIRLRDDGEDRTLMIAGYVTGHWPNGALMTLEEASEVTPFSYGFNLFVDYYNDEDYHIAVKHFDMPGKYSGAEQAYTMMTEYVRTVSLNFILGMLDAYRQ